MELDIGEYKKCFKSLVESEHIETKGEGSGESIFVISSPILYNISEPDSKTIVDIQEKECIAELENYIDQEAEKLKYSPVIPSRVRNTTELHER